MINKAHDKTNQQIVEHDEVKNLTGKLVELAQKINYDIDDVAYDNEKLTKATNLAIDLLKKIRKRSFLDNEDEI